jgi:hypothetical protein
MSMTRKRGLRALVAGAAVALLVGSGGIAQAEVVEIEYTLAGGSLSIGDATLELAKDSATIVGEWDSETGDLDAALAFTPFSLVLSVPVAPEIVLEVPTDVAITGGGLTGVVPPDGSEGEVTTAISVQLTLNLDPAFGGPATCNAEGVELALAAVLADGGETITATQEGFTVPELTGDDICAVANGALELPTEATSITMQFSSGEPEPTTTTTAPTTTTTVAPAPEPPVVPAEASPRFTG